MNKSNCQCPPIQRNCTSCSCEKKNLARNSPRGERYAESSPNEDDEDEDGYCSRNSRRYDKISREGDFCDDLIELLDDQMISTMSALRKKARKFMKSELEQSFSSDTSCRPCTCPSDFRNKDVSLTERANEIDYNPESSFLKKMVKQYKKKPSDCTEHEESDSGPNRARSSSKNRQGNVSKTRFSSPADQNQNSPGSCCCPCPKPTSSGEKVRSQEKVKKSQHMSRSKKKKVRGKRKRASCVNRDSPEGNLKQPHENSCERCWRFASPSRSPVNKPDQRFNPNFRKGRSCTSLGPGKKEEMNDSLCENPDCEARQNIPSVSANKKPVMKPIQSAPCENYSPQYTSFSERLESTCRSQPPEHSRPCPGVKELEFDYSSSKQPPNTLTSGPQRSSPRLPPCDKFKQKGMPYTKKVQNLMVKPPAFIPADCPHRKEEKRGLSPFEDNCGRRKPANIESCMKRDGRMPCQSKSGLDGSSSREGDSRKSGLSVLGLSEKNLSTSIQIDSVDKKSGQRLGEKSKNGSRNKSKDKSKNGKKKNGKRTCSTNEAKAYFQMPEKPETANTCGDRYAVLQCRCYPKKDNPEVFCCHCGWKRDEKSNIIITNAPGAEIVGRFTLSSRSPVRSALQEPPGSLGPRSCASPNLQKPCLPNIDECPEESLYLPTEQQMPCSYQRTKGNKTNYESPRTPCANVNISRNANVSYRSGYENASGRYASTSQGNGCGGLNCRNGNTSYGNDCGNVSSRNGNTSQGNGCGNGGCRNNANASYGNNCGNLNYGNANTCYGNAAQVGNNTNMNGNNHENCTNGNASYRNENANMSYSNRPNCEKKNTYENYGAYQQMPTGTGMDYPRKYCVMYMTKGKEKLGDDVEVLIEELCQPYDYGKDGRMADLNEKMTRVTNCPSESMALRFQKGVPETRKTPQKSRVLYF